MTAPRVNRTAAFALAAACVLGCGGSASQNPPPQRAPNEPTVWDALRQTAATMVLQCRGGRGFEFRSLGIKGGSNGDLRVAVSMIFAASPTAAGSKNQDLAPGTCAPAERPLNAGEPREVRFVTAGFSQPFAGPIDVTATAAEYRTDVRSLADYLRDPRHYWSFHVADTRQGYFDTVIHEHWQNPDKPAEPNPPRDADAPLTADGPWLVRVSVTGGIAGSVRQVAVRADGRLQVTGSRSYGNVRCSVELPSTTVQAIEAAIARARPETWSTSYANPKNPGGCCDQFQMAIHLEQADSQGRGSTHDTSWFNDSVDRVPEGVKSLFGMVLDLHKACATF